MEDKGGEPEEEGMGKWKVKKSKMEEEKDALWKVELG